jgi:hypothetical protein
MHGDMYETLWTKFQAHSLKTVVAAGSNMSPPPVREQLVNFVIQSATHCLATLVIHSCHCAPCMHESHAYHCPTTLHMWGSDVCMHITRPVTHSQHKTPDIADWLSHSPSPFTASASLLPQSISPVQTTQSVNTGLIYSDSPPATLHTVLISSADMQL